jgi:hypothetical protein
MDTRPYVRRCVSNKITSIRDAQQILNEEVKLYNYKRIHSVTGQVPILDFKELNKTTIICSQISISQNLLFLKKISFLYNLTDALMDIEQYL